MKRAACFSFTAMYKPSFVAHVVLLLVSLKCSFSKQDSLRVREERSGAEVFVADDGLKTPEGETSLMFRSERGLPKLRLQTHRLEDLLGICVRVRLSIEPLQTNESLRIELSDFETGDSYTLLMWKRNSTLRWTSTIGHPLPQPHEAKIQRLTPSVSSQKTFWVVRYNCFPARSGSVVSVSVHSQSRELISTSYLVKHTVPKASVTVDEHARRFTVRMDTDRREVKFSLCYNNSHAVCQGIYFNQTEPNVKTFNLSFPYLIPCVCVQLWFPGPDSRRNTQCPLKERALPHGGDILSSSSVEVRGSVLKWKLLCPADQSDPSVSLCWLMQTQNSYCVPASNSTLQRTKRVRDDPSSIIRAEMSRGDTQHYDVSVVDKHPQMCVKFSLNGSVRVFCPFESEVRSAWSVEVVPGSLHLLLLLSSSTSSWFAAQLCSRERDSCFSQGHIVSRLVDGGAAEAKLSLPFPFLSSGLCVQVWRLDLHGRRIICPDFTHRRWGLVTGSALALLTALAVLICITCYLLQNRPMWWRAERPVLLVCSSSDVAHVAAVCSLASNLKGELLMDVRLAQWAPSLAQLGPVPWLYGQCQAVQKAGGLVLISWSPDALQAFLSRMKSDGVAEFSEAGEEDKQVCCDGERRESSSITAPVLHAALSCLWTGLQSEGHGRGFGLLSFQALKSSSTYIPKQLRCVPKYCLPKDLFSLLHDLGAPTRVQGPGRCWPRLLSKALAFFMWRQLEPRLKMGLPKSSRKSARGTKRKTWRQKKRRSKAVPACLCRKEHSKKHCAPELLGAC